MTPDFTRTGAFHIDGRFATAIHYRAAPGLPQDTPVSLRFLNGRHEVAQAQLSPDQARQLLGPENFAALEKAAQRARHKQPSEDAVGPPAPVQGRLQGPHLHYRRVVVEGPQATQASMENAIHEGTAVRSVAARPRGEAPLAPADPSALAQEPATPLLESATPDAPARQRRIPDSVTARFLRMDNRFYFPDKTLAFIDDGWRLQAPSAHREVVRSLVDIALARGWSSITVTGQGEFRAAVWREAASRGVEVKGYAPSPLEQQAMERSQPQAVTAPSAPTPSPAKAQALRGSDPRSDIALARQHPDLVDAVVTLWLGDQFARSRWADQPQQRAHFVAQVRERLAQKVERGEPLHGLALRREVQQLLHEPVPQNRARVLDLTRTGRAAARGHGEDARMPHP